MQRGKEVKMSGKSKAQKLFDRALLALELGETIVLGPEFSGTQWSVQIKRTSQDRIDTTLCNIGDDGVTHWFYDVTTAGHQYGAPMIVEEWSLRLPARECGCDADGDIVGAIVFSKAGDVSLRASWSRLQKVEQKSFVITSNREFLVNGESRGFVNKLLLSNKNRLIGWIALVFPEPSDSPVEVLEAQGLAELAAKHNLFN